MSQIVLYRKYRPQSFEEVLGQDHIVSILKNAVKTGRISHAYLFPVPEGRARPAWPEFWPKKRGVRMWI